VKKLNPLRPAARIFTAVILLMFPFTPLRASPLSPLAEKPDWSTINGFAGSITATNLEQLLQGVYVPDGSWKQWISITTSQAVITPSPESSPIILPLARTESAVKAPPRYWKDRKERVPLPGKPLNALRIAIDPGHLGGSFAQMESRWFRIGHGRPVEEGEMTLVVAKLLKTRLESMGADVWLTRSKNGATTTLRPAKLKTEALESLREGGIQPTRKRIESEAERLFYRVGEIRNRARIVNRQIRPDVVVCLHFNAEEWGDPLHPVLTEKNHLHLLLSGAISGKELQHEDERYTMLLKLLGGTHAEELGVSDAVARSLASATGLPAFTYHGANALAASPNPYLWIRNLMANRLFECPVVYCEPYVMNSRPVFNRVQLGDYPGLRNVGGVRLPSIYREYADAVARGLADYYGGKAQ
jgi:N-acetylmuramoyl-L-alanine amidase